MNITDYKVGDLLISLYGDKHEDQSIDKIIEISEIHFTIEIIKFLSEEARESNENIGQKINLPRENIRGFRPLTNLDKMKYL